MVAVSTATGVTFESGLTAPQQQGGDIRRRPLRFEQTNSGVYEAEFPAEEVGAYFLNVVGKWQDQDGKEFTESVRGGVTMPYSPEFAEMESHTGLLEKIRDLTGGKSYPDDAALLASVARSGEVFRPLPSSHHSLQPIWPILAVLAGIILLLDVAVRRITIEPQAVVAAAGVIWDRLRGRTAAEPIQFLERLRSRKAMVGETLDKTKAGRRFEGSDSPAIAPPSGPAPAPPPAAAPRPPSAPAPKPEEPADFAARLLRAKKRAMEDRDKK